MTRWARGESANRKKALDATSWPEMVSQGREGTQQKSQSTDSQMKSSENKIQKMKKLKRKNKRDKVIGPTKTVATVSKKQRKKLSETASKELAIQLVESDKISNPNQEKEKRMTFPAGSSLEEKRTDVKYKISDLDDSTQKVLSEIIKKDERRENRRVKRKDAKAMQKLCFNCRKPGHDISDCPETKGDVDHGTGICFKCGSTEHSIAMCRLKLPPGEYPYAKCFICGEMGHLSKQCPDNPRGLYPKGGCCRQCGSVEHYRKDCPETQKQQGIRDQTLPTVNYGKFSVDDEISLFQQRKPKFQKKKPKIVVF